MAIFILIVLLVIGFFVLWYVLEKLGEERRKEEIRERIREKQAREKREIDEYTNKLKSSKEYKNILDAIYGDLISKLDSMGSNAISYYVYSYCVEVPSKEKGKNQDLYVYPDFTIQNEEILRKSICEDLNIKLNGKYRADYQPNNAYIGVGRVRNKVI